MPITHGIIGRFDKGDSRVYVDPVTDAVHDSVTTVNSATESKPFLQDWAAKLVAEYAVNRHEAVGDLITNFGKDAAIDLIKKQAKVLRELKADIGTHQHDILEALLLDLPLPEVPEHLQGIEVDGEMVDHDAISDGLVNFLTDQELDPQLAEATVANPKYGYAGTLDLIAWFPKMLLLGRKKPGAMGLIDLKSGKHLDPGMKRQQAAYRYCTEIWVDNLGNKLAMPEVDFCAVLHVRRSYERGYKFLQVEAGPVQFEHFLNDLRSYKNHREDAKLLGRALYKPLPDGTQPPPLLEDIDADGFGRIKPALAKAGIATLADLAALTPSEALALKGIAEKSMLVCESVLSAYGLSFKEEVA